MVEIESSLQNRTFDTGGSKCGYVLFSLCAFFTGLGVVSVLFGCSETMRDVKIVVEDTIVGCFEISNFF